MPWSKGATGARRCGRGEGYRASRRSAFRRWMCPRPRPFTSQPISKWRRIRASSSMPKQSITASGARHADHILRLQFEVRLVRYGKDDRLGAPECLLEPALHAQVDEVFLVAEKACQGMAGGRVAVLRLELVPVLDVGAVHADLGSHFR